MIRFRPAVEADVDAIVGMMRTYCAEDGYPFVDAEARQAVRQLLGDPALGGLWVAQHDGRVAGYLAVTLGFSLEYRGRDAFIDELYVAPFARGAGLGREAIRLAEAYCRERGVRALHLEVEPHREAARALYRDSGFQALPRTRMTRWLA